MGITQPTYSRNSIHSRERSSSGHPPFVMVSLLGEYFFRQAWFPYCLNSWSLLETGQPKYIVSDGSLSLASRDELEVRGFIVVTDEIVTEVVHFELQEFPTLLAIRERSNLFKKLIDTSLIFKKNERILYVDSDVLFRRQFTLPSNAPSFLFCIDDVPGYGGHWQLPLCYPIVTGLNSGFIYFDPSIVDLDYIDFIVRKYLLQSENLWWLEQTCWALLAGRIEDKGIFEGSDVGIISGLAKRTPTEIKSNKTKYFTRNTKISEFASIKSMMGDASVIHFAGPGKPWIDPVALEPSLTGMHILRWTKVNNANWYEKLFLALRMLLKG